MSDNSNQFMIRCERVNKKSHFKLIFNFNPDLIAKIKELPKKDRIWDGDEHAWHLTTKSLYQLISSYKRTDGLFFKFSDEDRAYFVTQIQSLKQEDEEEKQLIKDIEKKNKENLKFKQYLEDNAKSLESKVLNVLKGGDSLKLYPHQVVGVLYLDKVKNALISLEMGLGKAQKLDSKLLTPNGWVKMSDVKIGDQIFGSNGKPINVIGVYPQGKKDMYRVWFNDNTFTECCDEHLWSVNSPTRIWRNKFQNGKFPNKTLSLREIIDNGLTIKNGNRKHYIPVVEPIQFEKSNLSIDPYILGCLLGDGGLSIKHVISFTNIDSEIINNIQSRLPENLILKKDNFNKIGFHIVKKNFSKKNQYHEFLKNLNLVGIKSHDKFVPNNYKFSSIEQRIELLQGILDTDGHVYKNGSHVEITLSSKILIDDLQFIVQSLGGIGRIKEKWITYNGEKRLYYKLGIKLPVQFIPFKLSRKISRYKQPLKYSPSRAISKIEYIGKHEAQCIAVDAVNHLYVTDNCIVTHNTLVSIAHCELQKYNKVLVVTPNSLKFNYFDEVEKFSTAKAHIVGRKKNQFSVNESKYVIVNYEFFRNAEFDKIKEKLEDNSIILKGIDAVVFDETHKIKNTKSNTFKNIKKVLKLIKPKSKVFLSGTPAPNKAYELYSVLHEIAPIEFATKKDFYAFCGMHYDIHTGMWETDLNDAKFEELFHKIAPHVYRKRKDEVLKDLPDKIYQKITVEMTEQQNKEYQSLEEDVVVEFMGQTLTFEQNPLTKIISLRKYTAEVKIDAISEILESLVDQGEKVVVIDVFKEPLYKLYENFKSISVIHTGDQSVEERNDSKQKFQDPNSSVRLFFGSAQTCNAGLTLTAASKMFILTSPYSVGDFDQVADRLHRIGQKNTVFIYVVNVLNSIDEIVHNIIESKRKEILQVIDNQVYESNVSESFVKELLSKLKEKHNKKQS